MTGINNLKKVQKLYDDRITSSKNSLLAAGQWMSKDYVPLICNEIITKTGIKENDRVLELGCGSGILGNWLIKNCKLYVGIDLSSGMLLAFKNESTNTTNLIQSITQKIPFIENSFDKIIINGVTMYFKNKKLLKETLDEMKRVATKDATIFIGENILPSDYYWELTWFQNLSPKIQGFVKPYIRLRKWLALKNNLLVGKWKNLHADISPSFIKRYFRYAKSINQSRAASYDVKRKLEGKAYRGNRRTDFIIKL